MAQIKKEYYSWNDVRRACVSISMQMYADMWRPDYIVGITRGGSIPAVILSNQLDVPCEMLKVSLRDNPDTESNCWMAEDAFGYVDEADRERLKSRWDIHKRKNILIVDDINDTGATLEWIKQDWQSSCLPYEDSAWNTVWGHNVRFAVITENLSSNFDGVQYHAHEVNKAEEDVWLVYPWEKA